VKGRFPGALAHLPLLTIDQLLLPTESEEVKKEMRKTTGNAQQTHSKKRSRHEQPLKDSDEPAAKLRCVDDSCPTIGDAPAASPTPEPQIVGEDCVGYGYSPTTGELLVRYPIAVVSHREGVHQCHISGKQSLSGFK
jgi:hypothetical protein